MHLIFPEFNQFCNDLVWPQNQNEFLFGVTKCNIYNVFSLVFQWRIHNDSFVFGRRKHLLIFNKKCAGKLQRQSAPTLSNTYFHAFCQIKNSNLYKLSKNASDSPNVDLRIVLRFSHQKLWSSVPAGRNVIRHNSSWF